MASLLRLPFVFFNTISLRIVSTSPNPPVPKRESAPVGALDMFLLRITKLAPTAYWILAFAETTQILAGYIWGNDKEPVSLYLTPTSIVGTLLIMAGAYIRRHCYKALGSMFTFEVSVQKEHRLVNHGPYSIVRHPSYTGTYVAFVGCVLWYFSRGSFLRETTSLAARFLAVSTIMMFASTSIMIFLRVPKEDGLLRGRFGKEWDDWAKSVPYKLVPYVY